jgi:hypothetical protein
MENKMKKLIALFAVSAMASTSAMAAIALSGSASVSYDDNGSLPSGTSYDADLSVVGTAGTTTVTIGMDVEGTTGPATTGVDMATTIGPVTIAADMYNEVSKATTEVAGGQRYEGSAADDTGVTISVDAPIGDATVAVDDSGVLTVSGTWSGITMTSSTDDVTTVAGSIAGMDVSVTNDAGATEWTLGTTVSGIALTLGSDQAVSAMASTSAMSAIALSGAASVSYDDNGAKPSATTYDADLTVVGTAGTTTVTISADVDGASFATSAASMATTIGPVTIAADMHDEVSADGTGTTVVDTVVGSLRSRMSFLAPAQLVFWSTGSLDD